MPCMWLTKAKIALVAKGYANLVAKLDQIIAMLSAPAPDMGPRRIWLALPTITQNGVEMSSIVLQETDTYNITLVRLNDATKAPEPFPAGTKFTVVASSPALGVSIGADASGNPSVLLNAVTLPSVNTMGMNFTVTDDQGDVAAIQAVDYPTPPQVNDISLDVAHAVVGVQAAPTVPGP